MAGAAQAATLTIDLNLAITDSTVTTNYSIGGATFDLVYTLGSTSKAETTSEVWGTLSQIGVNWSGDVGGAFDGINDANGHRNTIEGADSEGLSFTGLQLTNFVAGSSGLTMADFTDLTFSSITTNNGGNNGDFIATSFDSFGGNTVSTNLKNLPATNTLDLTALSNYSAPATDLYAQATGSARWAVTGVAVTLESPINVPEPSSSALLGLSGLALILRRRK